MKDILRYLIPLVIGFLSGIFPTILAHRKDERNLKREKLENLYIDITNWYNSAFSLFLSFSLVMKNHLNWEQYLDNYATNEYKGNIIKDEIYILLYFPSTNDSLKKLQSSVQSLYGFIFGEVKDAYERGKDIQCYQTTILKRMQVCEKDFSLLREKLKNEGTRISSSQKRIADPRA